MSERPEDYKRWWVCLAEGGFCETVASRTRPDTAIEGNPDGGYISHKAAATACGNVNMSIAMRSE